MTRETKIGLLVGLAFIIVIGILLSDHLTATNEPQQAQLTQVGGNVRTGVVVPGAPQAPTASASVVTPATQTAVAPQQQVPTKEEITPAKQPVAIVQVAGSGTTPPSHSATPAKPETPVAQTPSSQEEGVTGADSNSTPTPRPIGSAPSGPGSITSVAHTMGEDVISMEHPASGAKPADATSSQPQGKPITAAVAPAGSRQYKAEPGDNLAKIATKAMGASTKANRDAIVAANPTLQQNPNLIVAGRTYVIPPGGSTPASAAPSQQPVAQQQPSQPTPTPTPAKAPEQPTQVATATPQYFYTVKAGDSLTKIAVIQLGNADAVPAIMDLNKDTLKGKETIRPNMKLRLPAKPLASAD
jgi:nucleoid-associated protein YgaU